MNKKISLLLITLLFSACSGSGQNDVVDADANTDINTEFSPVNLSGILADESISITKGFCKILNMPSDSFVIIAGRNPAYPEGIWLTFGSLDAIEKREYTLPSEDLQAGYTVTTIASRGSIIIKSLTKTDTTVQSILGTVDLVFTKDGLPGRKEGKLAGTFDCTFGP